MCSFHLVGTRQQNSDSLQKVDLVHAFLNDLTFANEKKYTQKRFFNYGSPVNQWAEAEK